ALAAGNAVVAKPSEETPSTATLLAEVIDAAGLPPGAFNLIHGHGAGAAGEHLTAHPGVDAIAFTGASATGSAIMRNAAAHVTPVSFELGGKNPALVFADADLDEAVEGTLRSSFTHSGQICLCTERVYVQRPIFDAFAAALAERARGLRDYGPMISAAHRDKVLSYYRLAVEEGATVLAGGGVPEFGDARDGGFHVEPTVLTGLPQSARTVREEVFGPICHLAPFDDEDEAVRLANDSPYGLAATVWTTDLSRAHRVAPRVEAGIVWVNCWNLRDLRTPFGGVKASGIGREGGEYSLDFFSEPVNVCVKI
ncbi:MAG: aldehyde dehydrogenase family protein, partial [Nonomuraea sp.]|nr:aldehyde dehydrogenase family protein [Nonomuraea sp.]